MRRRLPSRVAPPVAAMLLAAALPVHAWQAVPNAGSLLQQQQPARPPAPLPGRPALQVDPALTPGGPTTQAFAIEAIRIVGNTAFGTDVLHALVADAEGSTMTLPQLEQLAARLTDYYRAHGYPLSRAIVPAQRIDAGQVTLQVVEAHYGAIELDNSSKASAALLGATLAGLQPGQPITGGRLDRTLLLLSDVPGVAVQAIIKPGAAVGDADLRVATRANPTALISVQTDNAGNRYIGRMRVGATLFLTNPLQHGDVFDAGVIGSFDGMQYARLGYESVLNGHGTRAGLAYSRLHYALHGDIARLDAHGDAEVAGLWLRQPLLRARQANLSIQLGYDTKRLRDRIGALDVRTDRHVHNGVVSLNGDLRDSVFGGGVNAWSLGWTRGHTGFDDRAAALLDAASAQTRGSFSKWNANASRLQRLGPRDTLFLNLGLQWANANLDSAEKMTLGGPYTVRAFDIGAVSGDTGQIASAEWRHDLGAFGASGASGAFGAFGAFSEPGAGNLQATVFLDSASVRINRNAWTSGENRARLSGAGIGLAWTGPHAWRASAALAAPLGSRPALVGPQASVRAWITFGKAF